MMLYPVMSSHREISPKHRERMGIRENLVRLSVGIEAVNGPATSSAAVGASPEPPSPVASPTKNLSLAVRDDGPADGGGAAVREVLTRILGA